MNRLSGRLHVICTLAATSAFSAEPSACIVPMQRRSFATVALDHSDKYCAICCISRQLYIIRLFNSKRMRLQAAHGDCISGSVAWCIGSKRRNPSKSVHSIQTPASNGRSNQAAAATLYTNRTHRRAEPSNTAESRTQRPTPPPPPP